MPKSYFTLIALLIFFFKQSCFACTCSKYTDNSNENYIKVFYNKIFSTDVTNIANEKMNPKKILGFLVG